MLLPNFYFLKYVCVMTKCSSLWDGRKIEVSASMYSLYRKSFHSASISFSTLSDVYDGGSSYHSYRLRFLVILIIILNFCKDSLK